MTGDAFIDFADELVAGSAASEAACRSAISRAYYGAFHLSRTYLESLAIPVGKAHGDLWETLGTSGVHAAKQLATRLAYLHEHRIAADYDLLALKTGDIAFARDSVERAREVIGLLQVCSQEPIRSGVKSGIEAYRQRTSGSGTT